jgi:hypothetical protein
MTSIISPNENTYDVNELSAIRDSIELMTKFNQIEILRILSSCKDVTINENKYGIHINLTEMNNKIIENLKVYIDYVNTQEINLNNMEKEKEDCLNIYFTKCNKDNLESNNNNELSTHQTETYL